MKYLILDFNGTILDDLDVCIEAENNTIKHFNLNRPSLTKDEYLHIFTFPVKDYYEAVGFDWAKYSYEEVGSYWFTCYQKLKDKYKIFDGVIELLEESHKLGYKNILLSASSLNEVAIQLEELKIKKYFDEILGQNDIYAFSKKDVALKWIKNKKPKDCLMLGDTLHDLDVAKAMNVRCILIANGHQAKEILLENHDYVLDNIKEVKL